MDIIWKNELKWNNMLKNITHKRNSEYCMISFQAYTEKFHLGWLLIVLYKTKLNIPPACVIEFPIYLLAKCLYCRHGSEWSCIWQSTKVCIKFREIHNLCQRIKCFFNWKMTTYFYIIIRSCVSSDNKSIFRLFTW